MTKQLGLQITQAARGCMSGTLAEWPLLRKALQKHGYDLPAQTPAPKVRRICQQIKADRA